MRDIEYILDFVTELGQKQMMNGASLERVNSTVEMVCQSYGLHAVSMFSLSSILMISARDDEGCFASRQISIPSFGIHLDRLRSLNQLSLTVCEEKPDPMTLHARLLGAQQVREYPTCMVILGYALAACSLTFIFEGSWRDAIASAAIIIVLYFVLAGLAKTGINKVITNTFSAFTIGTLAIFLVKAGIAEHFFTVIIADTLIIIPGIPMVNAARNLLCGNEMNGILQLFKVLLEGATLALGLVLSINLFGGLITW